MEILPQSRPYEPTNVTNGVARPEGWTNLWVSDPGQTLPQTLELRWPQAITFDTVELTFDHSLCREHQDLPGFYVYPEAVRDYRVEAEVGGAWSKLIEIEGNVHRHRCHRFPAVNARALKIVGTKTNGALSMRVYEVRVYHDATRPTR